MSKIISIEIRVRQSDSYTTLAQIDFSASEELLDPQKAAEAIVAGISRLLSLPELPEADAEPTEEQLADSNEYVAGLAAVR